MEETCLGLVYWQRIFSPGKVAAFAFFFSSRWLPRQRVRARVCVCVCVCEREREREIEHQLASASLELWRFCHKPSDPGDASPWSGPQFSFPCWPPRLS